MRGWRIGRVGGIDIRVDPTWAVIAVIFTYSLWLVYSDPARFPDVGTSTAIGLAVLSAVLFFGSVLAHELAHAGMSTARDVPVEGIVLYFWGGATHARLDSKGPLDEFLITIVGPAMSAVLGGVFLLLDRLVGGSGPLHAMLSYLGYINLLLAVFNLVPGFPLDGGRVLRSIIWRVTGSPARATSIAARVGQVIGAALIVVGIVRGLPNQDFAWLWISLVGYLLLRAATEAQRGSKERELFESTSVSQLMSAPPPTIDPNMTVTEATARYLAGHSGEAFPVVDGGAVVGFVSLRTTAGIDGGRPVRDAMVGTGATVVADPGERMSEVTDRIGDRGISAVLVMQDGRLVGVVEPDDIRRKLRQRSSGGSPPPARRT